MNKPVWLHDDLDILLQKQDNLKTFKSELMSQDGLLPLGQI